MENKILEKNGLKEKHYNTLNSKIFNIENFKKDVSYLEKYFENNFDDFIEKWSFEDIYIFLNENKNKINLQKLDMDFNFYLEKNLLNEIDEEKMKLISDFLDENYSNFDSFKLKNHFLHKSKFNLRILKKDISIENAENNYKISFEYFLENTDFNEIKNFLKFWKYNKSNLKFQLQNYIFNKKNSLKSEYNPEIEAKISYLLKKLK